MSPGSPVPGSSGGAWSGWSQRCRIISYDPEWAAIGAVAAGPGPVRIQAASGCARPRSTAGSGPGHGGGVRESASQDWLTSAAARGSARCRAAEEPAAGRAGHRRVRGMAPSHPTPPGSTALPGTSRPPNTKPPQPEGNLGISNSVTCSEPGFNGGELVTDAAGSGTAGSGGRNIRPRKLVHA